VFAVISTYLLYFYTTCTEFRWASPHHPARGRCIDGIDAPVWGLILIRLEQVGRYRPWFLWLCGPYAVFGVLIS